MLVIAFVTTRIVCFLQIALEATKQFVDAQGITQTAVVPKRTIMLDYNTLNHLVGDLSPFTTYSVNVSAVPSDLTYRPPARITVTTQMAGEFCMLTVSAYLYKLCGISHNGVPQTAVWKGRR